LNNVYAFVVYHASNRPLISDKSGDPVTITDLMPFTIFGLDPWCTQTSKFASDSFEWFGTIRFPTKRGDGESSIDSKYYYSQDYYDQLSAFEKSHPSRIGKVLTPLDVEKIAPQKVLHVREDSKIDDAVCWEKDCLNTIQIIINNARNFTGNFLSMLIAMPNLKSITLEDADPIALSADIFRALALYLFDRNASRSLISFVMHARNGGYPYVPIPMTALLILFQLRTFDNFEDLAIHVMRAYGHSAIAEEFVVRSSRQKFESFIAHLLPQPIGEEMIDHVLFIN
jgi:hypothetical protein